jgi:hypothetical protein
MSGTYTSSNVLEMQKCVNNSCMYYCSIKLDTYKRPKNSTPKMIVSHYFWSCNGPSPKIKHCLGMKNKIIVPKIYNIAWFLDL